MMDQLISRFAEQLSEAIAIGKSAEISLPQSKIQQVYIAGMGGSGIGANFVASFVRTECSVPILIGKGYSAPGYIGPHTLAIASSYSGNTEETLFTVDQLLSRDAKVVCISSGGKLIDLAHRQKLDHIKLPAGWPSPRACLGYSLVAQLFVLYKTGLIRKEFIKEVEETIKLLEKEKEDIQFKAEKIAGFLVGKIPVIYAADQIEPVAVRFRQQLNENSKSLGWHHIVPELNHNELVGWRERNDALAVVILRNKDDFQRNKLRIDITKEIISKYTDTVIEIYSKGQSLIQRSLYLVHLVDWVSWHLAGLTSVDAMEIRVIDYLKSELSGSKS